MLKISITGPESTGKSTLARQLAAHYGAALVPEYAREYIGGLSRPYQAADVLAIARRQFELEDEAMQTAHSIVFCDTDVWVLKIWYEHAYHCLDAWLEKAWKNRRNTYHLVLLTAIDLPWYPDPQREHEHLRAFLFEKYRSELEQHGIFFKIITGTDTTRLQNGIIAVDMLIKQVDGQRY